jgi:site-specific recombinase XerD
MIRKMKKNILRNLGSPFRKSRCTSRQNLNQNKQDRHIRHAQYSRFLAMPSIRPETDIRYIKDLLGHFDIRATERYLHVSKGRLANIASPLDELWRKESLDL